jgi:hypothetical protein
MNLNRRISNVEVQYQLKYQITNRGMLKNIEYRTVEC